MHYQHIKIPETGKPIQMLNQHLRVPDQVVIPFIEGDGIGVDITPVMRQVVNAAVRLAYHNKRCIVWAEIYAGKKATQVYGDGAWLPEETLDAIKHFHVAIKGPLATPVGGGIRSINVALRQKLDLYICQRPVRWFTGTPSPVKHPELVDMIIFRENSEDIYAGIEWQADSPEAKHIINWLQQEMGVNTIRFPEKCGIGIKPVSEQGTKRLVKRAIEYAMAEGKTKVTLVHKGNIMKFTEGAFREWGYQLAEEAYDARPSADNAGLIIKNPDSGQPIIINDVIADAFLQQILLHPADFQVIATLNLNGDYISDALAAQVGGIGIAPGANIGNDAAVFEATHGTAPKHAGFNRANPGSLILSAEMMLRYLGWFEAADYIISGIEQTIADKTVTYDFAHLMDNARQVTTSQFGQAIIQNMVDSDRIKKTSQL